MFKLCANIKSNKHCIANNQTTAPPGCLVTCIYIHLLADGRMDVGQRAVEVPAIHGEQTVGVARVLPLHWFVGGGGSLAIGGGRGAVRQLQLLLGCAVCEKIYNFIATRTTTRLKNAELLCHTWREEVAR